jgi:outer membrane biosynthesis protein TonB
VDVVIDRDGRVISATFADGPYPVCDASAHPTVQALRQEAVTAAIKARFKLPRKEVGPLTGRITYSFSLPPAPELKVEEVTVGARLVETGAETRPSIGTSLPDTVSGGVLNGKATVLARPNYPAAARAVRASGSVPVQVLIAEDGSMFSAAAVSGHPLLRRNSEIAACGSRFLPTLLSGKPVKVSGIITYNYVP